MKITMIVAEPEPNRHCGVWDYAGLLSSAMPADIEASVLGVPTPAGYIPRHRILPLLKARRRITKSVASLPHADLVHVQYADFGWNGFRQFEDCYDVFTRSCRLPLVATVHEHSWFRNDHSWDIAHTMPDRLFSLISGHGFQGKDRLLQVLLRHRGIHVHHEWHKKKLMAYGVPEDQIAVMPLMIPLFTVPTEPGEYIRHRFSLNGKRILAMAGFVFDRKRYDRAIALLPYLPEDVVLCLLGGPNNQASSAYCDRLCEQARKLGVQSRVIITGYLDIVDFNRLLSFVSLILAPYDEVSSSASVSRAIAARVPVVASDCETFREMVNLGAGLLLADAGNHDALLGSTLRVLDDRALVRSLSERNAQYAANYSVTASAAALARWYERCLEGEIKKGMRAET